MEKLAALVWGVPTMVLLMAVGLVLTWQTRFVQVRRLGASIRQVGRSIRGAGRSSFQAVCTALAGTVGTGNIAGVAGAIALGGPGAVFWMWVAAFFGMATKYAEVVLAMRYRRRGQDGTYRGGPMYYIRDGLGRRWRSLAGFFAFFAVLASLGMGNMAQVHTVASAAQTALPGIRPELTALGTGLGSALLTALVAWGGARRIGTVMEKLVPVAAAIYVAGALAVIAAHRQQLGPVLASIVQGAFEPRAVLGGSAGIGLGKAIRWGVARGVFSNEAGMGSAPMAHASAEASPEEQGLLGIFEVFLDTVVLCTLTALAILTSGVSIGWGEAAGAELAAAALRTVFGPPGTAMLAVCLALLALATLMTWQLYGARCAGYLWGDRGERLYRLAYLAAVLLGATMELSEVWAFSDLCNGLMCLPNLTALLLLRRQVGKAHCKTG